MQAVWIAPAAVLAAFWLWFLALGRTRGGVKRIALRATLVLLAGLLVWSAAQKGLLTRASPGFRFALVAAVGIVTVGYLYLIRFCDACGRMVRNLKPDSCPRCGGPLPRHGMTPRLRTSVERRDALDRRARAVRPRHPQGPDA